MPEAEPGGNTRTPLRGMERVIAFSIAIFLVAQMGLLEREGAVPALFRVEIWVITLSLAALAARAWLVRRMLPAHADMLLLMLSWGGLGMLWGWVLDGGLSAMQSHMGHHSIAGAAAAPVYSGLTRFVNWMNACMLLFAFPPSVVWARCLAPYRQFPVRLVWVLALDAAGMIFGMMAGATLIGHALGMMLTAAAFAHHLGMLVGMLGGMLLTMAVRPWVAPLPHAASPLA
ncbi:MAG: hypothetical protein LC114_01675 [Bryobacterales bacterium]|nr:hypothetical protein [Bryobacterales bacterium]